MNLEFETRAERFLSQYRRLEGILEKRYEGREKAVSSVVREYLKDPDSEPVRTELDLCREIRNLLSHNADDEGRAVVEPSQAILDKLGEIIEYVQKPQRAADFGTPAKRILFAHPNDNAVNVMRHMLKMGYSHVPVTDKRGLIGVFSAGSLMLYAARFGLSSTGDSMRIGDLGEALDFGDARSECYMFLPENASVNMVREAFQKRRERNSRLAVVFLTKDGTRGTDIVALLTPWDVLRDDELTDRGT